MAEIEVPCDIQLRYNQLKNARLENVDTLPTPTEEMTGMLVYNYKDGRFYGCTGKECIRLKT